MSRRRLDVELVKRGIARSRSEAQHLIAENRVVVSGIPTPKPASLIDANTPVSLVSDERMWVSRGALKLLGALEAFEIDVTGRHVLDVGASTGGFTEVAIDAGAAHVLALDVGRGQLHESLQAHSMVTSMERTNFRHWEDLDLGHFGLVMADVSFISLCLLAEGLFAVGSEDTEYVLLVKPQFEAERNKVGRGGVVRDEGVRFAAVEKVVNCLESVGLRRMGLIESPVKGSDGNIEYLLWLRKGTGDTEDSG